MEAPVSMVTPFLIGHAKVLFFPKYESTNKRTKILLRALKIEQMLTVLSRILAFELGKSAISLTLRLRRSWYISILYIPGVLKDVF